MAQNHDGVDGAGLTQPEGPILCTNNCGCFGCASTMNLCSKCYRDLLLKDSTSPSSSSAAPSPLAEMPSFSLLSQKPHPAAEAELATSVAMAPPAHSSGARLLLRCISDADLYSAGAPCEEQPVNSDISCCSVGQRLPVASVSQFQAPVTVTDCQLGTCSVRPPTTPNRCLMCRKRLGLLGFKCRCGDVFCGLHRYSDEHDCSFDYKAAGREAIAKANPVVRANKVVRI